MAAPRTLTADQIAAYAYQAGFRGQGLQNIVAIAMAESGGDPLAYNPETAAGTAPGMGSVGLTQVYQAAHPQYSRAALQDPLTNLQAAYEISNGGQNFQPWSTWNNGAARQYLGLSQQAVANLGGGDRTMAQNQSPAQDQPTPTASPSADDAAVDAYIRSKTGGNTSSGKQIVKDKNGQYYVVDKQTGDATPIDLGQQGAGNAPLSTYEWSQTINQMAQIHKGQKGDAVSIGNGAQRYYFNDGTYLDVTPNSDQTVTIQGGTAFDPIKPTASQSAQSSAPNRPYNPDGSPNPNYDPNAGKTLTFPDGSLRQYDPTTGQWQVLAPGKAPAADIRTFPDGSLRQLNAQTGQWEQIAAPDGAEEAMKQAQADYYQALAAKAQQALRPAASLAIQQANDTISQIQQMLASGQIKSPAEANQLMQEVWDNVDKTLTGTTLYERQQAQQAQAIQRAQVGQSLLNQRIASGSSLASSILNAAAGHILAPPGGGSWGIDPFALANQEVNALGGGQKTSDLATSLLQGLQGGGQPSALQQEAAPNPFLSGVQKGLSQLAQQRQGGGNPPLDFEGQQVQTPPTGVSGPPPVSQQVGVNPIPPVAAQGGVSGVSAGVNPSVQGGDALRQLLLNAVRNPFAGVSAGVQAG